MGHGHAHPEDSRAASVRLAWVLALTAAYMVAELVGGLLSHSLAKLDPPAWLLPMYFRPGDSLVGYIVGNSADVFTYLFGSRLPGWTLTGRHSTSIQGH